MSAMLIVSAVGGGVWWRVNTQSGPNPLDGFAKCLAEKGVTMYGADWCSHCQKEKAAFGSAFQYMSYVECPADPQKCLALGIQGYPTWIFPDGRRFEGEQGLEKLAQESACALPDTQ